MPVARIILGSVAGVVLSAWNVSGVSIQRDFHHRRWTTEDGLPDMRIHCLAQTRDGYIWMGTRHGLVRFDGMTFTTFSRSTTGWMDSNEIQAAVVSSEGNLVAIAGVERALSWRGHGLENGPLLDRTSSQLWMMGPGAWTGTRYLLWNGPGTAPGWSRRDPSGFDLRLNDPPVAVFESSDGMVHVAYRGQLLRIDPDKQEREVDVMPEGEGPFRAAFCEDYRAQTWLRWVYFHEGTLYARLYRIGSGTPILVGVKLPSNGNGPEFLLATRDDSIWQPMVPQGLLRTKDGRATPFEIPWGRSADRVLCMIEDRESNLWLGTEESGLHRLRPRRAQSITRDDGLPHETVRTLAATPDRLWVGTEAGLARIDLGPWMPEKSLKLTGPAVPNFRLTPLGGPFEAESQKVRSVRSIIAGLADAVWIGSDRGLFGYREDSWRAENLPQSASPADPGSLGTRKIRAMSRDQAGGLWLATARYLIYRPEGLAPSEGMIAFPAGDPGPSALSQDRSGFLWAAFPGKGVCRFDPRALAQQGLRAARSSNAVEASLDVRTWSGLEWFSKANGLSSDYAWEIYHDSIGAVWIATETGLNRLPPDPRWLASKPDSTPENNVDAVAGRAATVQRVAFGFTTDHGLISSQIHGIMEDDLGHFWFGTEKQGIFRVKSEQLLAVAEGRQNRVHPETVVEVDGLPSDEVTGRLSHPVVCKTTDGRLWFATSKGIAVIDPVGEKRSEVAPLVAIEEVIADGQSIHSTGPDASSAATQSPTNRTTHGRPIRLSPGRARIMEFRFTALHFAGPEKCRFRYRLDGYDAAGTWHDAGRRRMAFFTNLDPGDYQFQVQAANLEGDWSREAAAFGFRLDPFYWQTWTFRIAVGVSGVGLVLGVVGWRLRELRRVDRLRQEKAVMGERLNLARDLHDIVGAQFTELIHLGELAGSLPVEEVSPVQRRMGALAKELFQSVRNSMWVTTPEADNLAALIDYSEIAARRLLGPVGIPLALDVPSPIPDLPLSPVVRRHLFLAVQEAFNNMAKHSRATQAVLRVRSGLDAFVLEVEDNGCGLPMDRLVTSSSVQPRAPRGGQGLQSIQERVREAGGSAEFRPMQPHGLSVRLSVPLRPEARH